MYKVSPPTTPATLLSSGGVVGSHPQSEGVTLLELVARFVFTQLSSGCPVYPIKASTTTSYIGLVSGAVGQGGAK